MSPETWGPVLWQHFHRFALHTFDPEAPEEAITFYTAFTDKIPCRSCRDKYQALLQGQMQIMSRDLRKRLSLFRWSWRFHNIVNMLLQKPQISFKEALSIHT